MTQPIQGWSKSLDDCHQAIQDAFPKVLAAWCAARPGFGLKVDYTWRGAAFQHKLYEIGREERDGVWVVVDREKVVTDKDGTSPSHHQPYPAQAADIYITEKGAIRWPPGDKNTSPAAEGTRDLYREVGRLWEAQGLVAGAVWKHNWKDWPHVQVAYEIV